MRLRSVKWMLTLTMAVFGLGMTAFSFQPLQNSETTKQESTKQESTKENTGKVNVPSEGPTSEIVISTTQATTQTTTVSTTVQTTIPAPTEPDPIDIPLEENELSEIDQLIDSYLAARLACEPEGFEEIVTAPQYIEIDKLKKKTEYIESYNNIKNYIKPAFGDVDYIVYVYHELKITSIETTAPALDEILVRYNESGVPQVVLGEISDETAEYVALARATQDVDELIKEVGEKLVTALKADKALAEFYSKLGAQSEEK